MRNVASILLAIYGQCKNIHYGADGMEYYAIHLLGDRLIEELAPLDCIDHLEEATLLGNGCDFVGWDKIMKPELIKNGKVKDMLQHLLKLYDALESSLCRDMGPGDEAYWTGVLDKVNVCRGFVIKSLKEREDGICKESSK